MLHTSPLAAAAGKRDIQEKEDEEEEHKSASDNNRSLAKRPSISNQNQRVQRDLVLFVKNFAFEKSRARKR